MPISTTLRKLLCCAPGRQEEEEVETPAGRPAAEPVEAGPSLPVRPYRNYVEIEAERYWREIVQPGTLTKPDQRELRTAALPVLCLALRNRPGISALLRAHMAANAVQLRFAEKRWLKHPYTLSEESPNHAEALVQLADDMDWLAREIPLPDHPAPKHPTIYYTIDPASNLPVPRDDALIRGDYVYTSGTLRLTNADNIHPWRGQRAQPSSEDMTSMGWEITYSLDGTGDAVRVIFHWKLEHYNLPAFVLKLPVEDLVFSPYPAPPAW